ncbi:bacitracin ABC transporter ATP-binding protein [Peribacillus saganii]|uniref:Bacitracin ABC transporter ATP-binding protein n=1 Tax=Peribacillus saganii TaxID=2303992 RepID=A0A372LAG8_9BACI|nr:hypothetical protein [Peribacillus saganii]RFU62716.1 bacitracin ABC transporter ATP-binding protein [Peribacillus saganii]
MQKDKVPFLTKEFLDNLAKEINEQYGVPKTEDGKKISEKDEG